MLYISSSFFFLFFFFFFFFKKKESQGFNQAVCLTCFHIHDLDSLTVGHRTCVSKLEIQLGSKRGSVSCALWSAGVKSLEVFS